MTGTVYVDSGYLFDGLMAQFRSSRVVCLGRNFLGKTLSIRPLVTIFFHQKWLLSRFVTSLNWEGAIPSDLRSPSCFSELEP